MGGFLSGVSTPELLAALAIPAGAALAYHGGRYTGPIGAGLAGFGGLGLALGQRQYNQAQLQRQIDQVSSFGTNYKGTPDEAAANKFFPAAGRGGMTLSQAVQAFREQQHPAQGKEQLFQKPGGGYEMIPETPGLVIPPAGAMLNGKPAQYAGDIPYTKPEKPTKQTPFEQYQAGHPGVPIDQQIKQYKQLTEKPREGIGEAVAKTVATTRARLGVINDALLNKPFGSVSRDVVPYKTVPIKDASGKVVGSRDVAMATTSPYGTVTKDPDVFFVPKTEVQNGTYARLQAIPAMGRSLVANTQALLGKQPGGPGAYANRRFAEFMAKPEYSKLQTSLVTYVDTVASSFSRRVNQSLIDQWKAALAPNNASPASVAAAVSSIEQTANQLRQGFKEQGTGIVNNEVSSGIGSEMGAPDVYSSPMAEPPPSSGDDSESF